MSSSAKNIYKISFPHPFNKNLTSSFKLDMFPHGIKVVSLPTYLGSSNYYTKQYICTNEEQDFCHNLSYYPLAILIEKLIPEHFDEVKKIPLEVKKIDDGNWETASVHPSEAGDEEMVAREVVLE